MNYRDVYYSRIYHLGETTGEVIRNGGIRSFKKWMAQSPFTINDLSVERGLYFSGIIEEKKDEKQLKTMYLHVALDIPVKVGDILNWRAEDGSTEKWILLQEERKVNGTYRTFWIIRCNYLVKWIDKNGRIQKSWSYVVSSQDDKVKGNFRTWHNLITPQPNKYAEIVMPRVDIARGTNFIIEDEGWQLIELDWTSVPGIIYLSLTESKVNYQYDDMNVDIADTDKLKFPVLAPVYAVNDVLTPDFGEDTFNEWEIELIIPDNSTVLRVNEDGKVIANAVGTETIIMQLKDRKAVQKRFEVLIKANESLKEFYIDGANTLRLDRKAEYMLLSEDDQTLTREEKLLAAKGAKYYIANNTDEVKIASLWNTDGSEYRWYPGKQPSEESDTVKAIVVHANDKNNLTDIILVAKDDNKEYTKTIKIIPLW